MIEIYVADASGTYHQVSIIDFSHTTYRDFQKGEVVEFTTPTSAGIKSGSWVKVIENGATIYRGAVQYKTGGWGAPVKWECESIPQLLKSRFSWPMRWGAPAIVSGYEALTNAQILSDTPPSQTSGVDQFVPGAIWMAQSYLSVSPASKTDGVWYFPGWGTGSRAGARDVYIGGHLCVEVDSLGALTDDYYQIYRNSSDLWCYGYGPGDFGPICIDGAFDYGLRMGRFDRGEDRNLTSIDIGVENYWTFIEDFLKNNGLYIKLRHTQEHTYIDASTYAPVRGTSAFGYHKVRADDCKSIERSKPKNVPPTALITRGKGVDITRSTYSLIDTKNRGAWIEELYDVDGGRLAPYGLLEVAAREKWSDISEHDYIKLKTSIDYLQPGDWIDIELSRGEWITGQIYEIKRDLSPIRTVNVGGTLASMDYAFLEGQKSEAIENMTEGQYFGSHAVSDLLGPDDTLTIAWTPSASSVRDTAEVVLSLEPTATEECNERGISATYIVTITNTLYPEGRVIAIIPWRAWCSDTINPFEELDITQYCALDTTEETIDIDVSGPTVPMYHKVTVDGIGRYNQTRAIVTMKRAVASPVSNTMNSWYPLSYAPYWSSEVIGPYMTVVFPSIPYPYKTTFYQSSIMADVRAFIVVEGVKYYGESRKVGIGSGPVEDRFEVNPYTLEDWTQSDLNNLQLGVKLGIGGTYGEAVWDLPDVGMPEFMNTVVIASEYTMPLAYNTGSGYSLQVYCTKLWIELR